MKCFKMTGQASYEFPQAPSLLTDSVNVLIKALTEKWIRTTVSFSFHGMLQQADADC